MIDQENQLAKIRGLARLCDEEPKLGDEIAEMAEELEELLDKYRDETMLVISTFYTDINRCKYWDIVFSGPCGKDGAYGRQKILVLRKARELFEKVFVKSITRHRDSLYSLPSHYSDDLKKVYETLIYLPAIEMESEFFFAPKPN